jgi:hypothetical protein
MNASQPDEEVMEPDHGPAATSIGLGAMDCPRGPGQSASCQKRLTPGSSLDRTLREEMRYQDVTPA